MVSEILNDVMAAEKQAAEKVDSANQKAARIIADADLKAKEIIDKAKEDGKKEAESLIRKNSVIIKEILYDSDKKADIASSDIREKAFAKKEAAIDMVIKKIISG